MKANQYIHAADFMNMLRSEGLVIVSIKDYESGKEMHRRKLLKRKSLTIKEIVDHHLLPLESKTGVEHWITQGKILPEEVYYEKNNRRMILTSAIKRLGYAD